LWRIIRPMPKNWLSSQTTWASPNWIQQRLKKKSLHSIANLSSSLWFLIFIGGMHFLNDFSFFAYTLDCGELSRVSNRVLTSIMINMPLRDSIAICTTRNCFFSVLLVFHIHLISYSICFFIHTFGISSNSITDKNSIELCSWVILLLFFLWRLDKLRFDRSYLWQIRVYHYH
jgi:hypothetical protein